MGAMGSEVAGTTNLGELRIGISLPVDVAIVLQFSDDPYLADAPLHLVGWDLLLLGQCGKLGGEEEELLVARHGIGHLVGDWRWPMTDRA